MESDEESSRCAHLATSIQQLGVIDALALALRIRCLTLTTRHCRVVLAILLLLHAANAAIWLLQQLLLMMMMMMIIIFRARVELIPDADSVAPSSPARCAATSYGVDGIASARRQYAACTTAATAAAAL